MKEQIEEMFNIIVDGIIDGEDNNGVPTGNTCADIATAIYNAGYRKQKEGEWIEKHCSICGEEEPYTKRGNAFATTFYQFRTNFCPNCGARMKGGE